MKTLLADPVKEGRFLEELFRAHTKTNKPEIRRVLALLFALERLPFRKLSNGPLATFATSLNPAAMSSIPSSPQTLRNDVLREYAGQRVVLQRILKTANTRIFLSADIWTSPNNILALGFEAGFLNFDGREPKSYRLLIGLREVDGHSGEDQFKEMKTVVEELGIQENIGCIMGDNSGTNDTLSRFFGRWFQDIGAAAGWKAQEMRVRCLGHIINLIVKAWLMNKKLSDDEVGDQEFDWIHLTAESFQSPKKGPGGKQRKKKQAKASPHPALVALHNVVASMAHSPQRQREFHNAAGRMIPRDNATRWNSWQNMISVAVDERVKAAIQLYQINHEADIREPRLTLKDWDTLEALSVFLTHFSVSTELTEGGNGWIGQHLLILTNLHDVVVEEQASVLSPAPALLKTNFRGRKLKLGTRIWNPGCRFAWILPANGSISELRSHHSTSLG